MRLQVGNLAYVRKSSTIGWHTDMYKRIIRDQVPLLVTELDRRSALCLCEGKFFRVQYKNLVGKDEYLVSPDIGRDLKWRKRT